LRLQSTRGRLLASTIICGAAIAAAVPAFAQDTTVDAVVVTGSRIARQDYVANSPVSTVTSEQIETTGSLQVEQILNALPQVVPGFTAASNNPSDGTSTVDLRGLGPQRTLVLVNGRRTTPATKGFSSTDLNTIPTGLIDRVEVMTGGASAVYGSDALAGVVNFILKKNYEGLELGTQYGISGFGDGEQFNLSLLAGANTADGRGNVTTYLSYYDRDQVLPDLTDRPWSYYSNAGGSATGRARFDNVPLNPFVAQATQPGCPTAATSTNIAFNNNGTARGFCNNANFPGISDRYNFSPVNPLMSFDERWTATVLGRYDITDALEANFEVDYTDNRNGAQLAPTPMTGLRISVTNPFLTPSALAVLGTRPTPAADAVFRRRMIEVGARQQDHNNKTFNVNFGLNADLPNDWKVESYISYGRTEFTDTTRNDVSRSRVIASQSGTTAACSAAALAIFPNCVPVNLFGEGTISTAGANFIRLNFTDQTIFERTTASAVASGSLFTLPAGDVAVALGVEYREDSFSYTPDAAHASGDIFGFNMEKAVSGGYSVGEIYGEAVVPLVSDVTGVKYLGLELGARWSDYSSVGNVTSYKAGGEYEPFDGLRFRAMYQRASRAPNVFELFQAGDQGFPAATDPCSTKNVNTGAATPVTNATKLAMCTIALGGNPNTLNYVQPNSQLEAFFFGNPNLAEEVSDTYTVGLVWQPEFISGLKLTLDYYDIKVDGYIGSINGGTQGTINACYSSGSFASAACNDPAVGALTYRDSTGELKIRVPLGNVSSLETKGIDLGVTYGLGMDWWTGKPESFGDKIDFQLNLTKLDSYVLDGIDYAGTIGAYNISATLPEYKAVLRVGYDIGPVRFTYMGSYWDAMDNQGNIPAFADGGYTGVDSYWYHDINAQWAVNDTVEIFGGIKNIADEEPPVFDNANDGNTDPNSYDVIGRYFYVGGKLKF
jgi:outer membrane receptor protein involved in Fe transport